ncbi:MAG: hypothetical protein R3E56_06175 [Burkholderiaceae bacterium]
MAEAGLNGRATKFTFAAFDGTNNDEENLKLSGDEFRTNVGELRSQARDGSRLNSGWWLVITPEWVQMKQEDC